MSPDIIGGAWIVEVLRAASDRESTVVGCRSCSFDAKPLLLNAVTLLATALQ